MPPRAKSLILDLLSSVRRGSMPVRALVAAGDLFGIAGNSVRVALVRLLASGLVERDERGRYRLGPGADAVNEQIRSWRRIQDAQIPWHREWVGVHGAVRPPARAQSPRSPRSPRSRRNTPHALRFLGFRWRESDLALRPANLPGGIAGVREQLRQLGLDPRALVFSIRELDAATEARATALWDGAALARAYEQSHRALVASEGRLRRLPRDRAMAESFLLGGQIIRQLVLDPRLPESIAPAAPRNRVVEAMGRYDALGRECWADFLASFGVPHLRTPADMRLGEATGNWVAATGGIR